MLKKWAGTFHLLVGRGGKDKLGGQLMKIQWVKQRSQGGKLRGKFPSGFFENFRRGRFQWVCSAGYNSAKEISRLLLK